MLIEFRTKNFKSFLDEAVFSMLAAPKQKGLDYSLHVFGKKMPKVLCSSVIYGANASGKTNLIGAMDVFQSIVQRGHIRNTHEQTPNYAASSLELIPNREAKESEPVSFYIDFIENGFRIQYSMELDFGSFLDGNYNRKILEERLLVNEKLIFLRNDSLQIENLSFLENHASGPVSQKIETLVAIARNSLNPQELFLTNGFKSIISPEMSNRIAEWFSKKFMVIYRADSIQLLHRFVEPQKDTVYVEKTTNEAAKLFGINSNGIGYLVAGEDSKPKLCSIFDSVKDHKNRAVLAEMFESYGTLRFVNMFPLVIRAMSTGGTLVVDEFDASIHPMALMNIVNIFHNDEINIRHAQLIFNTHNPIFLNSNLFRRDEIKFAERDETSHNSSLYSLSDFGTSGENGVRKNEDYMKNYFVNRYGAVKNIDFSPVFEEIMSRAEI